MPELADEGMIAEALAQYALQAPRVVELLEASYRNENYVIEDGAGSRYVLRRCRRNPTMERIRFQVEFQDDLLTRGFPTAATARSRAGDVIVQTSAGIWTLSMLVEGSELDYGRPEQIAEAGWRLAEFHTLTQAIDLPEVAVDANQDILRWWTHGEEEVAAIERMCVGHGVDDELKYISRECKELVASVPLPVIESLPRGWVHGDYGGRNMIFVGHEMRALIDFDETHRGFPLEDVAKAVVRLSRVERTDLTMRPEAARLFLESYEGVRRLTDDERNAMVAFGTLGNLPRAGYFEMMRRDGDDWVAYVKHTADMMKLFRRELARFRSLGVFG